MIMATKDPVGLQKAGEVSARGGPEQRDHKDTLQQMRDRLKIGRAHV